MTEQELIERAKTKDWKIETKPDGTVYVIGEEVVVTDAWALKDELNFLLSHYDTDDNEFLK